MIKLSDGSLVDAKHIIGIATVSKEHQKKDLYSILLLTSHRLQLNKTDHELIVDRISPPISDEKQK